MNWKDEDSYAKCKHHMTHGCIVCVCVCVCVVYSNRGIVRAGRQMEVLVSVLYCFEYNLIFSYHLSICVHGFLVQKTGSCNIAIYSE